MFSELAEKKLILSGICPKTAKLAGLESIENARETLGHEFASRPALIIPYFDILGNDVFFKRDGEKIPFFRIRYLEQPKAKGFVYRKPQRYAQMKGSGSHPYFPPLFDWQDIANDPSQTILITEGELKALKACQEGFPTIGLGGVDCFVTKRT